MTTKTAYQHPWEAPYARFLGHRDSIFLFVSLTAALTILLAVFGQPTSLTQFAEQRTSLSPLGEISICFTTGIAVIILSRILLFFAHKHRLLNQAGYIIWLFVELVLAVSVMTLVLWGISGAGTVRLAPLAASFALGCVSIEVVPYVIAFLIFLLNETKRELQEAQQLLLQKDPSATPSDSVINFYTKSGHLALSAKSSNILYIESADNYVNIHYLSDGKEETLILLNSMKNIEKSLSGTCLVRCHRGYLVNVENVRLMRKDGLGLLLELNHTSKTIPVSKSYTDPVTHYFAHNTTLPLPDD